MTYYNLSVIADANSSLEMIKAVDSTLANGMLGLMFILSFAVVLLINNVTGSFTAAFAMTMFITTVVSSLLWLAGLISLYIVVGCIVLLFFGIILYFFIP